MGRLPHDHDLAGAEQPGEFVADAGQSLLELLVVLDAAGEKLADRNGRHALAFQDFVDLLDSRCETSLTSVRHGPQVRDRLVVRGAVSALAKRPSDLVLLFVVEPFPAGGLFQFGDGGAVHRDAGVQRHVVASLVFAADGGFRCIWSRRTSQRSPAAAFSRRTPTQNRRWAPSSRPTAGGSSR